jgi:hypothetical protein
MTALFQLKKRFPLFGFLTSARVSHSRCLRGRILDNNRNTAGVLRFPRAVEGFPKNFDVCRTRSVPASY